MNVQYKLIPQPGHVTVIPLKTSETKQYTNKILQDVETSNMDVLQYGKVVVGEGTIQEGSIVMYPKLASDKTNFGDPRQVIVETAHIKAYLEEQLDLSDIVNDSTDTAEYGSMEPEKLND